MRVGIPREVTLFLQHPHGLLLFGSSRRLTRRSPGCCWLRRLAHLLNSSLVVEDTGKHGSEALPRLHTLRLAKPIVRLWQS